MSCHPRQRQELIERGNKDISITRQSELLGVSRSGIYYQPRGPSEPDKELMDAIDEIYMERPFYGKRRMRWALQKKWHKIWIKKTRSLMRTMGIQAIWPRPNTSKPHPAHPIYPYLLRGVKISTPNHVWATDITYIRINWGWIYLVAVIDWHSRYVLSWGLSITLETWFCTDALGQALTTHTPPEIFNTDQGCQFTSYEFTSKLEEADIRISMDGRWRYLDNIFIERLWRTVKYEEVYLRSYETVSEARASLKKYFQFYNHERPHSTHNYKTPADVYFGH
jgi:putative transposase